MILSIVLACLVAVPFLAIGMTKVLALKPMREKAAESGHSVSAYRVIGALEVAGAAGVVLGLAVPLLGGLAGAGLLLLMAGAVITHVRNGDARGATPALVCAALVAAYLAALFTA
ncbi:DoxX family protein [Streptomyces spongiae]|uniref:Invasion protein n=1 Tax=Streptomyces spongiae TaxID=565072 RepID=A0A5N8X9D9_9ACTN|nr:DoxX family protein [Streptomyces spongiae]MPY55997.1 invasion protein [Streptomyces spongiae]